MSGVDPDLIGARVVAATGGSGGYAEQVAVDAVALCRVPDGLDIDSAVAVMADGRTATMLIAAAGVTAGDRVLVEAAAGGVGTLLVQLARAAGATVVGVAGGARKVEVVESLGADLSVDYTGPGWVDRIRDAIGGVDVVFDGVGAAIGRSAFELLGPGGRMLSFGLAGGEWAGISDELATERGVTLVTALSGTPAELRTWTGSALAATAAGTMHPVIGQRFPLERAADAHAAMESRSTIGKTLLVVRR